MRYLTRVNRLLWRSTTANAENLCDFANEARSYLPCSWLYSVILFPTVGGPKVVPGKEGAAPADGDGDRRMQRHQTPKTQMTNIHFIPPFTAYTDHPIRPCLAATSSDPLVCGRYIPPFARSKTV
jgi:hypothetical protein